MNEDRILNLQFWISMVSRRRWWILGSAVGVTLFAALFSFIQEPVYEATCRLYLNRQRVQPMVFNDLYSKPQVSGRPADLLLTQMEIILSTPVIEGAVRDLEQKGKIDFKSADAGQGGGWMAGMFARLTGRGGAVAPTADAKRATYVAKLQEKVGVTSSGGNAFLLITVPGRGAQRVADLANAIADSYLRHDRELVRHSAEQAIEWLNEKVHEQKDKLLQAEDSLRDFAGRPAPRLEEMGGLAVQEVGQLQQALLNVRLKLLQTQTADFMKPASGAAGAAAGSSVEREVQSAMRTKVRQDLVDASMRLAQLRRSYGDKHPDVIAAAEKEQQLKDQLASLGAESDDAPGDSDDVGPGSGGTAGLKQQEKALKDQLDRAMRSSASNGQAEITYAILKREAEINRSLYNEMVSRLNEITMSAGLDSQVAEMFEPARPPAGPISPVHSRDIMLGLFGGLFLGLAIASVREHLDHSVRDPAHANDLLRAPVLGMVPFQEPGSLSGPGVTQKLAVGARIDSPAAEAYRILRSHIEGVLTADETRAVLITSAMPGEGKSTTAANLAAAFAEANRRVLLIDGDFRRPSLTRYFKLSPKSCLSKALTGEQKPETMIQSTEIRNLSFLGCQPGSPLSSSSSLNEQFRTFFEWARTRYDHVIIDTPIMMVTPGVTDIAHAGASIVLVHRPGRVPAQVLVQIRDHVTLSKLNLVGVVLNAVRANWLTHNYAMLPYYASYYPATSAPPAQGAARES